MEILPVSFHRTSPFMSSSIQWEPRPTFSASANVGAGSVWPSDFIMRGCDGPWGDTGNRHQHRPSAEACTWTRSWLWVKAMITQMRMALRSAWPLDTTKASGCNPNPRLQFALWWQHGPRTSTQFRGMIGPWIRHGPQPQLWLWTLGLYVGPRGNMAHGCQHRPKLQWDHGPNMVLSSSQNLDITMAQKAARTTQIGLALVKFLE